MTKQRVDGVHADQTAKPHIEGKSRNAFTALYQKASAEGMLGAKTKSAIDWFRNAARAYKNPIQLQEIQHSLGNSSRRSIMKIGHMYIFKYHAKYAQELPYWDSFPLVFPFKEDATHFWAINLHYASPRFRAFIMEQLYGMISDDKMNEMTRLRITYKRLNRMASFKFFAPMIKCYLKSNFQSQFIHIPVDHWQTAMFLPVARWNNQTAKVVYRDYEQNIKKPRHRRIR
jgi:hypothetical protein